MLEVPSPKNDDELWQAVVLLTGVQIPRAKVCEGHVAPFTAFADAYFARDSMAIWKGSRGLSGKTLSLSLLSYIEAIFLGASEVLLGGSGQQSKRVLQYQDMFWNHSNSPKHLLKSEPTATHVGLRNGGRIVCLMASQTSVRGEHPQRLRLDEIDEMSRAIFDAAQGQTMEDSITATDSKRVAAQTVASSTHQNPDGTMDYALQLAAERGWPVYEWCYRESMGTWTDSVGDTYTGWLSPAEVERKRREVSAEMWRVEYELGEPTIGSRAILTDAVDALFDHELGQFGGDPDEEIIVEPFTYIHNRDGTELPVSHIRKLFRPATISEIVKNKNEISGLYRAKKSARVTATERNRIARLWTPARYVTGVDWAKEQDWTVIVTFRVDVQPARLVAYLRTGRKPWNIMVQKLNDRIAQYPGRIVYDRTGVGNVVRDYIQLPDPDALPPLFPRENIVLDGMVLTGQNEDNLLTEYIAAVERGDYKAPFIRHAHMEHKYASVNAIYGSDHLPDTICAFALAHRAAKIPPRRRFAMFGQDEEQ